MDYTYQEILKQSTTWEKTLHYLKEQENYFSQFLAETYDNVIFTGCGSSYNLSLVASHFWQTGKQIPARGVPASETFLFPGGVFLPRNRYLLFGISRSGETTETVKALQHFQDKFKGKTVGVSCEENSSLLKAADYQISLPFAHEESVVMTQSFPSILLSFLFLSLLESKSTDNLSLLPEILEKYLSSGEKTIKDLVSNLSFDKFIFLGNGPYYGIAWEGSLKLKEMSLTSTETFHFLEFRHGPKSVVDEKTLIIALSSQRAFSWEKEVMMEMMDLGATILHLGKNPLNSPRAIEITFSEEILDDFSLPVLYLPFLQLLGYYRAKNKGLNPDTPRYLAKVVKI
ncbi:MAG TPA: SIS domain-containing protein [Candidatus Atribacteria bacterium]|nr:SIS domain-containing protein [Candidatus Atribacteria bacterium]